MFKRTNVLFAAWLVLSVASAARAEKKPDGEKPAETPAKEDLATAIAKGIEMLEAEKTTEFLERYMIPGDVTKLKKDLKQWDAVAEEFKKDHNKDVLKALKFIKDSKPEMSEEGELTVFDVSKLEGKHPDKLHFRKIKDVWYIADH